MKLNEFYKKLYEERYEHWKVWDEYYSKVSRDKLWSIVRSKCSTKYSDIFEKIKFDEKLDNNLMCILLGAKCKHKMLFEIYNNPAKRDIVSLRFVNADDCKFVPHNASKANGKSVLIGDTHEVNSKYFEAMPDEKKANSSFIVFKSKQGKPHYSDAYKQALRDIDWMKILLQTHFYGLQNVDRSYSYQIKIYNDHFIDIDFPYTFARAIFDVAKHSEIDLEHPEKTKLNFAQALEASRNNDREGK